MGPELVVPLEVFPLLLSIMATRVMLTFCLAMMHTRAAKVVSRMMMNLVLMQELAIFAQFWFFAMMSYCSVAEVQSSSCI